ncbi:hypothetical protein [Moritella viscosa]|uniref:hypothetical protein n=1 Tax=Moritella viscosa TaxID=80854 RepID=UPI00094DB165|nr:hypothetical protein [Moritella viscosa]
MNEIQEKQLKYLVVHLCRVSKALLWYMILPVNLALAAPLSCESFTHNKTPYIDQSELSALIFGIERRRDEITSLYAYLNEIGSISISYDEFKDIEICLTKKDNRFFIRNRNVLLMALFSRIEHLSSVNNRVKKSEKNRILEILFNGDIYEVGAAIDATAVFKDEAAVDALGRLALESEKEIIIDDVLSALHLIGTETARVKVIELKRVKLNFMDDIDDYLQRW